jgi:GNAT superfamily N-acetyltransferase
MSDIKVKKVISRRDLHDFLSVPKTIYAGCSQYVPDLKQDIVNSITPQKNAGLSFSDLQAFVAYKGDKPVGRIVGIVNHKANKRWNTQSVRFSLIEFIDDLEVSAALLDAVAAWGQEKGMTQIIGPMGITDFDKEGMLVDSFCLSGATTSIYNLPYYPEHMEKLGYEKEVDWVQIRIQVPDEVPPKYARVAQYCGETLGLSVRKLTRSEIKDGNYGKQIFHLFNQTYADLFGFSELSESQIDEFTEQYLKLIDLNLVPVVFNDKDEMVGVAVTMPSLAEAMRKSGGSLWPFGWYHLLKALKWKRADNVEMLLIAVRPDYQGMGVNAMFFNDLIPVFKQYGFKWAETGPQLETNIRELSQWKPLNPETVKRRRCFKKMLSSGKTCSD